MPRVTQRDAYGGFYSKTTYRSSNNSQSESSAEFQERMRRRFEQQQQNYQQSGWDQQNEARGKAFEEILRQQRAYEEKMRSNWFASRENLQDMHEELMKHQEELARRKLFAFFATLIGMWMFFTLVFKIFSGPQEVVVIDPTTGRRRIMKASEFEELERRAYLRQLEMARNRDSIMNNSNSKPGANQSGYDTVFGHRNPYEEFPENKGSR